MNLRKATSLLILQSFILLLITSVVAYLSPKGKIAFWADWNCWGLGKESWGPLHTNIGILFIVAALLHIALNIKPIFSHLKTEAKKLRVFTVDFNVALLITLIVTILTLLQLPPINSVQNNKSKINRLAAIKYGEPPYGHAENSTLSIFCKRMGLNLAESIEAIQAADLAFDSETQTLLEIAQNNQVSPQLVYETIRPAPQNTEKELEKIPALPRSPGMGFGRKILKDFCNKYELDPKEVATKLKTMGIEAQPEERFKTIAENNDTAPSTIFQAIIQIETERTNSE